MNGPVTPAKPFTVKDEELQKKVEALTKELMAAKNEKARIAKMGLEVYDRAERKEEELKEKTEEVKDLKIMFEALGGGKAHDEHVKRTYRMA